jgi:hypothetical protein
MSSRLSRPLTRRARWITAGVLCAHMSLLACGRWDASVRRRAEVQAAIDQGMREDEVLRIVGTSPRTSVGTNVSAECQQAGGSRELAFDMPAPWLFGLLGTCTASVLVVCLDDSKQVTMVTNIVF